MARLPRLSVAGVPHLVEQGGHNGQALFLDSADRRAYRESLREAATASGVALHAYLLDTARVLLLATPRDAGALSRMMQRVGRRYTAEFNRRHERSGTLWSGRFRATVLQPGTCFIAAMRHVESDAAVAGDGGAADGERISSVAHHLGLVVDPLVSDHALFWALGNTPFERHAAYGLLAMQPIQPEERRRFDDAVRKGWALGTEAFLAEIAATTSRRVRPLTAGRPRKSI
ncbi:transposase [Rhizobacter sp. AJA081-3]|jgi:putative transposase|uniref:transposase n=1 Tax=Rhizobacter sp. AJA081-3 TaxID=2753607 RepID=UPI001ADF42EA|nr:transposase [Rhizobacter sp. AJA081-3]QTN21877.1 transposase [Rhizobacter sp. AJA081-3]